MASELGPIELTVLVSTPSTAALLLAAVSAAYNSRCQGKGAGCVAQASEVVRRASCVLVKQATVSHKGRAAGTGVVCAVD